MKLSLIIITLSIFLISSCGRIGDARQDKIEKKSRKSAAAVHAVIDAKYHERKSALENFVKTTSLKDKVCQLFIVNIDGDKTFVPVEKDFIPGGYLFFSYNLAETPEGIMKFTDSIRSYCHSKGVVSPFLAIDQEGGYVNRLRTVCGPLPSAKRVSDKLNVETAYRLYSMQAIQMKALGFNMNLAPVVEVETKDNEKFLDGRSFGDKLKVRSYGTACVNAFENRGIATVIKHFPGNTNTDPHSGLPEIKLSEDELNELLVPFSQICRAEPKGVLMSHARTSCIDSESPACFSKIWINSKLKDQMKYNGIVFSDDVFMGALASNGFPPETAAVKAIESGINCIMISEKRISGPAKVLIEKAENDRNFAKLIDDSFRKIVEYKMKSGFFGFYLNSNGDFVLVEKNPVLQDINSRLEEFNKARLEDIDIYQTYF